MYRLGLVGYTNISSGIGCFIRELFDYLGDENTSILSVNAGIKGQEKWTDRQYSAGRPPSQREITEYLDTFTPDVVLFIETPFAEALYPLCRQRGIKTIAVPMHETFSAARLKSDLMICTCYSAYEKAQGADVRLLFLPIGLEMFPFVERTGHTFLMNIGYGGPHDRRQSSKVVHAFQMCDNPDARLIVNCQQSQFPPGVKVPDERITYFTGSRTHPREVYNEGDIYLAPMAYGGYERPILEAMASGMPTLTTNADPMNLFQHDSRFLIEPCRKWLIKNSEWVVNTIYNEVSAEDLAEKMRWLMTIDTAKFSARARAQAFAQSWEDIEIPYLETWKGVLEELCNERFDPV